VCEDYVVMTFVYKVSLYWILGTWWTFL